MDIVLRQADREEILARLARYNSPDATARRFASHALSDILGAVCSAYEPGALGAAWRREHGWATAEDVTAADTVAALRLVPAERMYLDATEVRLIEAARDRGETWRSLAGHLGYRTPQALQQRYRRIGGRKSWPTIPVEPSCDPLETER